MIYKQFNFIIMKKMTYFLTATLMLLCSFSAYSADYTFSTDAEVNAFVDAQGTSKVEVGNLTITGVVTQDAFAPLVDVISAVNGDLTFKDLTVTTWATTQSDASREGGIENISEFIATVELRGGLIIQNTEIDNIGREGEGNYLFPEVINGDLIIDYCRIPFPGRDGWHPLTSFGNIKEVKGNFILGLRYAQQSTHKETFTRLEKVGGDFRMFLPGRECWECHAPNFTSVGGDLEIRGPGDDSDLQFWSLEMLRNIEFIGGNVTIVNLPKVQMGASSDNGNEPGYCFIRYLIDEGIVNYACNDVVLGYEGEDQIDLALLGGCYDGMTEEVPPSPLPEKTPGDCATGISTVKVADSFATAFVSNGVLNVDSKVALSKMDILTVDGKLVASYSNIAAGKTTFPINTFAGGFYLVKLSGENNQVNTAKIIK